MPYERKYTDMYVVVQSYLGCIYFQIVSSSCSWRKIFESASALQDEEAAWCVHTQLDAKFWGISKTQFQDFLRMVRCSIRDKEISNPSEDRLTSGFVWVGNLSVICLKEHDLIFGENDIASQGHLF